METKKQQLAGGDWQPVQQLRRHFRALFLSSVSLTFDTGLLFLFFIHRQSSSIRRAESETSRN